LSQWACTFHAPASARTRRVGAQLAAELQGLMSRRMLASLLSIVNASGVWPNLSLNPDASPAALVRRPLGAG